MLGIRLMVRTGWIPHFSPCDSVTWGFTHIVNITNHSFRASKSVSRKLFPQVTLCDSLVNYNGQFII